MASHPNVTVDIPNSGGNKKLEAIPEIPRFPLNLRELGKARNFIAPKVVSIGPYHHGKDELKAMEEVKGKVIGQFFQGLSTGPDKAKKDMMPIALSARDYYDDNVPEGIAHDGKFCEMMFADGCFLVQFLDYKSRRSDETQLSWMELEPIIQLHSTNIMSDIMLLENQIPWTVIKFLMDLRGLTMDKIICWLTLDLNDSSAKKSKSTTTPGEDSKYQPSYLLCLLHHCKVGNKPDQAGPGQTSDVSAVCTGAAELAEMGIKLAASKTKLLSDMEVVKCWLFAELSLVPLSLDNSSASWLINMVAFEMCTATSFAAMNYVSGYLAVVALLIEEEHDVSILRTTRIISATMSNKQTLKFFKDLAQALMPGMSYLRFIYQLEDYKRKRWVRIAIYRFFYTNAKTIATVLSIMGVLAGIFKTLLSLKQK